MPFGVTLVATVPPASGGGGWDPFTLRSTGTPATAAIPGGTQPGDLMVCWSIARDGTPSWTSSTGWSDLGLGLIGPVSCTNPGDTSVYLRVLFRVATGSDPAPTTVSCRSPTYGAPVGWGHEMRTQTFRRTAGGAWVNLADAVVGSAVTLLPYTNSGYPTNAIAMPAQPADTVSIVTFTGPWVQSLASPANVLYNDTSAIHQVVQSYAGHYSPGALPATWAPQYRTGIVYGCPMLVVALRLVPPDFTHTGTMST